MTHLSEPTTSTSALSGLASGLTPASHFVGIVSEVSDQRISIASGSRHIEARRAQSCLVAVSPGDTVAGIMVSAQEAWVVSVLEREDGTPLEIRVDRSATLSAPKGSLKIEAESLELQSATMHLKSDEAEWVSGEFRFIGSTLKLVGQTLRTVFDVATQHFKQYSRTTEGHDRTSAAQKQIESQQLLQLSGEHTLIEGKRLVKARGAQIHFG